MTICSACGYENPSGTRICADCGVVLAELPGRASLIGQLVGERFRVERVVAEGGMGIVYEAEQRMGASVRKVALKTLLPELSHDPVVVSRFNRECGVVAQLDHPNTVRVYDFGRTGDGVLYIAMEFVRGRPLGELLAEGPLALPRALGILEQIAHALEEAHDKGIVHRDLKPDNVVLTTNAGRADFVKLLDFGIAARSSAGGKRQTKLTQQGTVLGTPPYMSPEQFTAEPLDRRSDVYSLGVIAYEMLSGKLPFEADSPWEWAQRHLTESPRPLPNSIPEGVRRVVIEALSKGRDGRPSGCVAFFEALSLAARAAPTPGSAHELSVTDLARAETLRTAPDLPALPVGGTPLPALGTELSQVRPPTTEPSLVQAPTTEPGAAVLHTPVAKTPVDLLLGAGPMPAPGGTVLRAPIMPLAPPIAVVPYSSVSRRKSRGRSVALIVLSSILVAGLAFGAVVILKSVSKGESRPDAGLVFTSAPAASNVLPLDLPPASVVAPSLPPPVVPNVPVVRPPSAGGAAPPASTPTVVTTLPPPATAATPPASTGPTSILPFPTPIPFPTFFPQVSPPPASTPTTPPPASTPTTPPPASTPTTPPPASTPTTPPPASTPTATNPTPSDAIPASCEQSTRTAASNMDAAVGQYRSCEAAIGAVRAARYRQSIASTAEQRVIPLIAQNRCAEARALAASAAQIRAGGPANRRISQSPNCR